MTIPQLQVRVTQRRCIHWMNTQQLFLLVYVVSVMHALQQGYTDKAESYAKKALHLIDKQRSKYIFVALLIVPIGVKLLNTRDQAVN